MYSRIHLPLIDKPSRNVAGRRSESVFEDFILHIHGTGGKFSSSCLPFLASSSNFLMSAVSLSTTFCILANTQSLLKQLALYEDPEGSTRFYVQSKKSIVSPLPSLHQVGCGLVTAARPSGLSLCSVSAYSFRLPVNSRAYLSTGGCFQAHLTKIKGETKTLRCCLQRVCRHITFDFN